MKNRKLKVRSGFYDHSTNRHSRPKPVPFVLLKGLWLQAANFEIGKEIQVEVKDNQLILTISEQ